MKSTILTEDELEMLRNLTASASSPTETIDISSDEFLALLFKAKKIRLDIHFTQHHLSFPLDDIQSEQLASLPLGVPDIYEVVTTSHRLWRLQKPKYLSLVDEQDFHYRLRFKISHHVVCYSFRIRIYCRSINLFISV